MKKALKKRKLYFFLEEAYPENLWLSNKFVWPKRKKLPVFKKNLYKTQKHLKVIFKEKPKGVFKSINSFVTFSRIKKHGMSKFKKILWRWASYSALKKRKFFFLFTIGQAINHVTTPLNIYRKISHLSTSLKEKKKFSILYGLKNQKKFIKTIQKGGKFAMSTCTGKIDVLFFQTGCFPNIIEVHNEWKKKGLLKNTQKILSLSIPSQIGDFFQFNNIHTTNYINIPFLHNFYHSLKPFTKRIKYRVFLQDTTIQNKKSFLLLKKIFFYRFFLQKHKNLFLIKKFLKLKKKQYSRSI